MPSKIQIMAMNVAAAAAQHLVVEMFIRDKQMSCGCCKINQQQRQQQQH